MPNMAKYAKYAYLGTYLGAQKISEDGEIYTAGNKFYTAAGTDRMDEFHLWCRA